MSRLERFIRLGPPILLTMLALDSADAQLPQLVCCGGTSGTTGLAQGAGDAIADEELVRGDVSGLQGASVKLTDTTGVFTQTTTNGGITLTANGSGKVSAGVSGLDDFYLEAGRSDLNRYIRLIPSSAGPGGNEISTSGSLTLSTGGTGAPLIFNGTQIVLRAGVAADTGLTRAAAGVAKITDGGSGLGWEQWAGECYVAADVTNATTTLATTGCSIAVTTGRKYAFKCALMMSDSLAADGAKIDFAGGTATESNFRSQATAFDTALAASSQLDDITDVASAATFTGGGNFEVHGSFEPGSAGTFVPRFAQSAHTTGTLTLFRGSHCLMWDTP